MTSWRTIVVVATSIMSVTAAGEVTAQTESAGERVPTPNLEVGHVPNHEADKRGEAGFGIAQGVKMVAEGAVVLPFLPRPLFPDLPDHPLPRIPSVFGSIDPNKFIRSKPKTGDDVAVFGVLQQPGEKSKYMYVILLDYGKVNRGGGWMGFSGDKDPRVPNRHKVYYGYSMNSASLDGQQKDSRTGEITGRSNSRGQPSRRGASRANTQENPRGSGGFGGGFGGGSGFGGGGIGGSIQVANDDIQLKFTHEFEIERNSGRLKTLEFKINEIALKKGSPQVFLADFSGEKLKLIPVDVKLPEEAPDVQDNDQKTWGETVKKTIDYLRENSSEVNQFMNKRTVHEPPKPPRFQGDGLDKTGR